MSIQGTHNASLVSFECYLFLVGGSAQICVRYAPITDSWTLFKQPSLGHWGGSAFVSGGKIYVCGGDNDYCPHDAVSEYDIEENNWSISKMKMPKPLNFFKAAMVQFK